MDGLTTFLICSLDVNLRDSLDERKQCNLRELARVHSSKALVILRMSISRQRKVSQKQVILNSQNFDGLFKCEVNSTTFESV